MREMRNRDPDQRRKPIGNPQTLKRMPTREEYVSGGIILGGNREEFEQAYDRWAAEEAAKKGE